MALPFRGALRCALFKCGREALKGAGCVDEQGQAGAGRGEELEAGGCGAGFVADAVQNGVDGGVLVRRQGVECAGVDEKAVVGRAALPDRDGLRSMLGLGRFALRRG